MDINGYGSIRGRMKDMIIRGGENVYPAELENLFLECPGVKEAQVNKSRRDVRLNYSQSD